MIITVGMRSRLQITICARAHGSIQGPSSSLSTSESGCRLRRARPQAFKMRFCRSAGRSFYREVRNLSASHTWKASRAVNNLTLISALFEYPEDGFEKRDVRSVFQINPDFFSCAGGGGLTPRLNWIPADSSTNAWGWHNIFYGFSTFRRCGGDELVALCGCNCF